MKTFFYRLMVMLIVSGGSAGMAVGAMNAGMDSSALDTYKFDTAEQQSIYLQLIDELRCPKCQNQNIAGSNAGVANDIRNKVYKLVVQGQNKQQVIDFMVERYGHFVYYKPPVTAATIILWLLPIAFVLFTLVFMWFKARRSQLGMVNSPWDDEKEQQLDSLIGAIEQKGAQ